MIIYSSWESPIGTVVMVSDGVNLTGLKRNSIVPPDGRKQEDLPVFLQTSRWLAQYFAGENPDIAELPLNPSGTSFQKQVWQILLEIPWGQTRTYGEIARELATIMGKEKMSPQAVGQAVGRNPIWIVIPCHRCVGAKGKLTGYAGGLDIKDWLLRHEGWRGAET